MQNTHIDSKTTAATTTAPTTRLPGGPNDWRTVSNLLCIWALCGRSTCRKAAACRGDSRDCIARCGPLIPPNAKAWALQMAACERTGLSFDDARRKIPQELEDAWLAWSEAVRHSARRPHRPAIDFAIQHFAAQGPRPMDAG